ncbi:MAG: acyl carrier protein [Alphaproteobacteria bacterium]|jgi:acyl carrier protein|nr:acyl carrier protein [Alphaproteobacteria bacterium]
MTKEEIFNVLKAGIVDKYGINEDEVVLEANLTKDLPLDSLDILYFIQLCEDKFKITIPDEVAEEAKTVEDFVNIIYDIRNGVVA